MQLTFISAEFPYPPNHGGRSDTWQRLCALAESGVSLQLICWYSDRRGGAPSATEIAVVKGVVHDLIVLPINIGPLDLGWRLFNLWRMPSHASARAPYGNVRRSLLAAVKAFSPQAIWLDGLWAGAFARDVAAELRLPYFYRSHNIEHRYMARQASLASSPTYRLRLTLTLLGLKAFEERVVMNAAHVFDISVTDLAYWKGRGLANGQWLAPIVKAYGLPLVPGSESVRLHDVVFIGNLHTPNNIEGLRWFLHAVWPLVAAQCPAARALIAGSAPSAELLALIDEVRGVEVLADPTDVWPLYRSARVLINPARSGSGVNIKSVEMLQLDCPIVSTTTGVGGLPPNIQSLFLVADEPADFAKAIAKALSPVGPAVDKAGRAFARKAFTPAAINEVIAVMKKAVTSSISIQPPSI